MRARFALTAAAMVACAEPASVDRLRVTTPDALVELVPTPDANLAIAWELDGHGPLEVALTFVPDRAGAAPVAIGRFGGATRATTWPVPTPAPQHGTYRVRAEAWADDAVLATDDADAIILLVGAHFRDAALTFTGADAERDVWLETTVGRPVAFELWARAGATSYLLSRGTIASDLAPVGRVLRWPEVDLDGAAVPAGTYAVELAMTTADGEALVVDGLTVTWTP